MHIHAKTLRNNAAVTYTATLKPLRCANMPIAIILINQMRGTMTTTAIKTSKPEDGPEKLQLVADVEGVKLVNVEHEDT